MATVKYQRVRTLETGDRHSILESAFDEKLYEKVEDGPYGGISARAFPVQYSINGAKATSEDELSFTPPGVDDEESGAPSGKTATKKKGD